MTSTSWKRNSGSRPIAELRYLATIRRTVVLTALVVAVVSGCGGGGSTAPPSVTSVVISATSDNAGVGGTVTLQAVLRDANARVVTATVTWKSSDESVATVSASGVVTGVAPGVVTITASAGGAISLTTIVIRAARAIAAISVTPNVVTLNTSERAALTAAVQQPAGAPKATIEWSAGTPTLASVSTSGFVTALAAGRATINVIAISPAGSGYARDSLVFALIIEVVQPAPAISSLIVTPTSPTIAATQTIRLIAITNTANASIRPTFSYVSNNPAIATVDSSGLVTGVSGGTAVVTVTAFSPAVPFFASVTLVATATVNVIVLPGITSISVQPAFLQVVTGQRSAMVPIVQQPSGAPVASLSFASSALNVATIAADGLVTAVAPGNAVITVTATTTAGNGYRATTATALVPVQVSPPPSLRLFGITQGSTLSTYVDSLTPGGSIRGLKLISVPAGGTVDITNVKDVVRVQLFVDGSNVAFDSLAVAFISAGGTRVLTATQRGVVVPGNVIVDVNTADFTIDATAGTATVRLRNGQYDMRAVGWYRLNNVVVETLMPSPSPINVNNLDGFALALTPPSRTATDGGGRTWWGGSGAQGVGSFTAIPVVYSQGRQFTSVTMSFGRCTGTVTKTAAPFRATFGGNGSGADINCGGIAGSTDAADGFRAEDYPMIVASSDNVGGAGVGPRYAYDPGPGAHPWAGPRLTLWHQSPTWQSPPAIRVDYAGVVAPP